MSNITLWLAAIAVSVAVGAAAAHYDIEADRQDEEALDSRDFAGQQVCGPNATPEWLDDKTLQCLRHIDEPVAIHAPTRPMLASAAQ